MPNLIKLTTIEEGIFMPTLVNVDNIDFIYPDPTSNNTTIYFGDSVIVVVEPLNRIEKMIHRLKQ